MDVTLQPSLLQWSRRRAGFHEAEMAKKLGTAEARVLEWETSGRLTYAQAQKWARVTHTPFGYLFLLNPPVEALPVSDFRTVGTQAVGQPSPELLDVLYEALRRQDWYRDYLMAAGDEPSAFVVSLSTHAGIGAAADAVRGVVQWDADQRAKASNWEEALSAQSECVEAAGVLVMRSSIVGNNTHRPLSLEEFRGFALSDPLAPLIFINSRDAKAAQMFTLAHELVHIWLGVSGVSNLRETYAPDLETERFCNTVAAELLVPGEALLREMAGREPDANSVPRLVRYFKVSGLVIIRRLRDLGLLSLEEFQQRYREQAHRYDRPAGSDGGGDFYRTLRSRLGRRFVTAVVESSLEGQTSYRDAFRLLGVKDGEKLRKLAREVGVPT